MTWYAASFRSSSSSSRSLSMHNLLMSRCDDCCLSITFKDTLAPRYVMAATLPLIDQCPVASMLHTEYRTRAVVYHHLCRSSHRAGGTELHSLSFIEFCLYFLDQELIPYCYSHLNCCCCSSCWGRRSSKKPNTPLFKIGSE